MLPIYKYITNEANEGMDFIALVDSPAHMKNWVSFSDQKPFKFKQFFNEEKRIVMGVAIATEVPIYRNDQELGEHYAVFTKDETEKIWERMMSSNFMHNVNEMHEESKKVEDIFLIHSYPIDYTKGINPPTEFEAQNLKDGSIIAFYKVNSDDAWDKVKSGQYKGFSIEGYFDREELKINKTKMKKNKKSAFKEFFKELFNELDEDKKEFAEATTVDGVMIYWEGELTEGIELKVKGEDNTELLAPEGDHLIALEDGTVQVVTVDGNGIIIGLRIEEATEEEVDEEFNMDDMTLIMEGFFKDQKKLIEGFREELRNEFKKENETLFGFIKENLDKEDKRKFESSSMSWRELTKQN